MKKQWMSAALGLALSLTAVTGWAHAHVVVYPQTSTQGTYEKFTVRVPTEKDVPTVKLEVQIPADVNISRFEPKQDWKYDLVKDATGKITSVIWTATGAGLGATEFGEFNMQGKVGDQAAQIVWKAIQTYKDGSVVEWGGAAGSSTPASVTKVTPAQAGSDAHGGSGHTAEAAPASASGEDSPTPLYLSIAALVLGAAALLVALLKKPRR